MALAGGYIPPADNRMLAADSRHNLPQPVNCMNRTVATNGRKCSRTTKASTSILKKSRTEPVFGFETSFHLRLVGENLFRLPVLCFTITIEVSPVGSFTLSQPELTACLPKENGETFLLLISFTAAFCIRIACMRPDGVIPHLMRELSRYLSCRFLFLMDIVKI